MKEYNVNIYFDDKNVIEFTMKEDVFNDFEQLIIDNEFDCVWSCANALVNLKRATYVMWEPKS